MKTPLSPSQFLESGRLFPYGGMCLDLTDTPTTANGSAPHLRLHSVDQYSQDQGQSQAQTQGQPGGCYSLCEVCNLQLGSAAQAQLHCNGRSHLRRLRQIQETGGSQPQRQAAGSQITAPTPAPGLPTGLPSTGALNPARGQANSLNAGSGCGQVGGALPRALVGGPSVMMQSGLNLKPFLSFPVDTASPAGLFPNYNTMDPVQKAVINHTFGVTIVPKRKQVISCNICQLRFNSDSQAEAHYKGSRHAKKLKSQENKAKAKPPITGETNSRGSSPSGPAPAVSSGKKHTDLLSCLDDSSPLLLCLSSSSSSLCSSSPSPSRAGSEPPPSSPPSASPAPGLHSSSSKASPSAPTSSAVPSPSAPQPLSSPPPQGQAAPPASQLLAPLTTESEEEKAKKLLYCSLCKVAVNSLSQLEAHNTGSKHKTMMEARSGAGPIKAYPRPGAKVKGQVSTAALKGSGLQNKTFHCQICDVHVNSEIQLKQHISSRRHKDRVAGKPMKPKYSPYNKQQRSSAVLAAKLVLQKDLVKSSIAPAFLSSPFCPPSSLPSSLPPSITLAPSSLSTSISLSASSISPSLSLHPRPAPSLFTPSFLRPAPGPIRASQGSILFAPY